jgi:hypothetical protein
MESMGSAREGDVQEVVSLVAIEVWNAFCEELKWWTALSGF